MVEEQKSEEKVVEQPKEEEETWKDIDELLAEANSTHFVKLKFRGKVVKVAWKELSEDEIAAKTISLDRFKEMPKIEQDKLLTEWLEDDVLAKIKKAGKTEGCLNSNEIDKDAWKKLPARIRLSVTMDILETRDELMRNFQ